MVSINNDTVTILVFEDTGNFLFILTNVTQRTVGLQVGDTVLRVHKPLSVQLGPGNSDQYTFGTL